MSASRRTRIARTSRLALGACGFALLLCATACRDDLGLAQVVQAGASKTWQDPVSDFQVPPPPFSAGVFPCTDCHDPEIPVNTARRELKTAHQEILLQHDQEHRWCLDCHDAANRDMLHLAGGALVSFEESYRLCGQCHGDKYRDWRAGVHGRRTGRWDGEKSYLLCVHCHNSHAPAFQPIEPMPAPTPPRRTP
ncbi:MAG: hypothetical protein HOP15_13955 [Planctomycetes bacterium]|nr:hypothetical protein [Planctomycetota bacterium]